MVITPARPTFPSLSIAIFVLLSATVWGRPVFYPAVSELRSSGVIFDSSAPISYPAKIVQGPRGNLLVLDSELSNVFVVNAAKRAVRALCERRLPITPSDIATNSLGDIWVLNSGQRRVARVDDRCQIATAFTTRSFPIALVVNSAGEIVVLTGKGDSLFETYDSTGKLLRSFGQRLSYGSDIADQELSGGHLISDGSGGVYFSFNYPPAVRHYARDGRLLAEFKPESDIAIMGTPQISSRKQGNQLSVISRYQILVLDLGLDARGRLLMLLSGENKFEALTHGSRSLLLTNRMGKTLANFDLADGPFNRLTTAGGLVYMLKNHSPIRLDKVVL